MSLLPRLCSLAAACLVLSVDPASAQDAEAVDSPGVVSAADLPGVAEALRGAGYQVETHARSEEGGLARIDIVSGDEIASLIFNDCNDAIPDYCETIVLSTWWDRNTPISDEAVAAANQNLRYVSVFRDQDGDPEMQWAILTRREGVPATVLLDALRRFLEVAREFEAVAFDGDEPVDEGAAAAADEAADAAGDAAAQAEEIIAGETQP